MVESVLALSPFAVLIDTETWKSKFLAAGLALSVIWLIQAFRKKSPVHVLAAYVLGFTAFHIFLGSYFAAGDTQATLELRYWAFSRLFEITVVAALVPYVSVTFIFIASLLSIVVAPFQEGWWLMGNPSMNGCMLALGASHFLHRKGRINICLAVLCMLWIVSFKQIVPYAVLAVSLLSYKKMYRFFVVAALGFLSFGGLLAYWPEFFSGVFTSNGRFDLWWAAFREAKWAVLGHGLGSTFVYLPVIQQAAGLNPTVVFTWFHNDWLQSFFELGFVGGGLVIAAFVWLFSKAREYRSLLAGYAVMMFFNYPLMLFPTMLLLGRIGFVVWTKSEEEKKNYTLY